MRCSTFQQRVKYLSTAGYPVLRLEDAIQKLARRELPKCATVITIDDGFPSVFSCAVKSLSRFSFPATIYLCSYYSAKQNPVFRLAVQYLFWKTKQPTVQIPPECGPVAGEVSLSDRDTISRIAWDIIRFGEEKCDEPQRVLMMNELAKALAVDISPIVKKRAMHVMSSGEIRAALDRGMDIELHTHRHRFPDSDPEQAHQELVDNRAYLDPLVGRPLSHFCYPSGEWSKTHWPILVAAGIRTATTCEPGLNYSDTPFLALRRFLDSEDLPQIEFEAELSGFGELIRKVKRWMKSR